MKPGTVFRWNNFPNPKYGGDIKPRWFICLGKSGIFNLPVFFYLCTTTTNIQCFQDGGTRCGHAHFLFKAGSTPFDEDCILDYDEAPYPEREDVITNNQDIEIKGELLEPTMRMIWNRILKSDHYSRKTLLDIHVGLNNIGINGLKKP